MAQTLLDNWLYIVEALVLLGGYALALILIPRILLDRREAGATLAWIMAVAFVPYLGALLFFLIGRNRVLRKARKKILYASRLQDRLGQLPLPNLDGVIEDPSSKLSGTSCEIATVATRVTQCSLLDCNSVEVYVDTATAYDRMEQAIRGARHHVHMMSYIFRDDSAGLRFRDLLLEKAKQGVQTRLLVDAIGSRDLSPAFIEPLQNAGGQYAHFLPVLGRKLSWRPNLRNHRKILVVDGEMGFVGGLNIGDEYQGRKKRFAPWRDTHLRLQGPAVRQLQEVFAQDWYFATDRELASPDYFPNLSSCGPDLVQIVDSGPDKTFETIHAVFFTAVNQARKRILITTPYFVPDPAMLMAIKSAAWRNVEVKILVPGQSDLWLVKMAGRSYFRELLEAGVQIYEHHPGMLHAKTMVVDGVWSTVGSANMDIRSFRLNFEVNALIYGSAFAEQLERVFYSDIATARQVSYEEMADETRSIRFAEALCRVLSPVL